MVSHMFPAPNKHATNINATSPAPHPTLINHHPHLLPMCMLIGGVPLTMEMRMGMMKTWMKLTAMMSLMMTSSQPPNLLNSHHSYPESTMSNPQTMICQTSLATGETPIILQSPMASTICLTPMLNDQLAHGPKSIGLLSTCVPTHPLFDLQPRHSLSVLAFTAPMIS